MYLCSAYETTYPIMKRYLFKKYWPGAVVLTALFLICLYTGEKRTVNDALSYTTYTAIFLWILVLIFSGKRNPRRVIIMVNDLFNFVKLLWYVVSLKPLRRWIKRLVYVGVNPTPYPYLALYGSLLDTHMMKNKFSAAFSRDKTPATRAAVWRLLSRGALVLGTDDEGHATVKLADYQPSPSDGLDPDFERTVYQFIANSEPINGVIDAKDVAKTMTHFKAVNRKRNVHMTLSKSDENQFRFADLLNTGISFKAYTQRDVQNIFGMKRFLKQLPDSFQRYTANITNDANDVQAASALELPRIWKEYMTYAYLFGMEKSTFKKLAKMMPNASDPLLHKLASSAAHRKALSSLMSQVSTATPGVEDSVAAKMGRMPLAWHVDEIYDF